MFCDDYVMDRDGLLSTHSVKKMAIIFAQGNGCTKMRNICLVFMLETYSDTLFVSWDYTAYHGHWNNSQHQQRLTLIPTFY